ncbi:MAG: CBS domain-containing protein [bacterium]
MGLDVAALATGVIFELPASGVERIADRHVQILVHTINGRIATDVDRTQPDCVIAMRSNCALPRSARDRCALNGAASHGTKLAIRDDMKVSKLMIPDVITCNAADTLDFAAQQMWTYDVGVLPVVDDHGRIVGVLTDRDALMGAFTRREPLHAISAGSTMSADPFTCSPDDELTVVETEMGHRQIHRVAADEGRAPDCRHPGGELWPSSRRR